MKKLHLTAFAALIALFIVQGCKKEDQDTLTSPNYITLKSAMRELWSDHMQWTYTTVDAFYHNPNGVEAHLNRLLQNQQDLGDAIVPYYGQAAGETLAALLTTHILQAVPVLQAAEDENQAALNLALANWYANAQDIADFLTATNPVHWPKSVMDHTMEHHISQTTTYAVDLLKGDFNNAVIHYDQAFNHMMETADLLAKGIALQHPNKF